MRRLIFYPLAALVLTVASCTPPPPPDGAVSITDACVHVDGSHRFTVWPAKFAAWYRIHYLDMKLYTTWQWMDMGYGYVSDHRYGYVQVEWSPESQATGPPQAGDDPVLDSYGGGFWGSQGLPACVGG